MRKGEEGEREKKRGMKMRKESGEYKDNNNTSKERERRGKEGRGDTKSLRGWKSV